MAIYSVIAAGCLWLFVIGLRWLIRFCAAVWQEAQAQPYDPDTGEAWQCGRCLSPNPGAAPMCLRCKWPRPDVLR